MSPGTYKIYIVFDWHLDPVANGNKVQLRNKKKMLLRNAYIRNPLFLGLQETSDRYMKSVLWKQHAFEQFFLFWMF